jgi:predicted Zn-dependent protease
MGKSKVLDRKRKEHSVEKLLQKAEELVDQCQPELAIQFYEKALLQTPQNTFILDMIGELSTEIDQPERALEAFQKSISLEPSSNPSKWFYAAQLLQGEEAEKYLNEGIAYLRQELQQYQEEEEEFYRIRKQICDAYCSLGELYMTDLW